MEFALKEMASEVYVPDDDEYINEVKDILENETFQSMKSFIQHGKTSCLEHCIAVSYRSYLTCKRNGWNARAAARAGLLHDLFLYDWHWSRAETGTSWHGITHPRRALENAEKVFDLTPLEKEIILRHMWPLTLWLPRSREAYAVIYHDKVCSLKETVGRPSLRLTAAPAVG